MQSLTTLHWKILLQRLRLSCGSLRMSSNWQTIRKAVVIHLSLASRAIVRSWSRPAASSTDLTNIRSSSCTSCGQSGCFASGTSLPEPSGRRLRKSFKPTPGRQDLEPRNIVPAVPGLPQAEIQWRRSPHGATPGPSLGNQPQPPYCRKAQRAQGQPEHPLPCLSGAIGRWSESFPMSGRANARPGKGVPSLPSLPIAKRVEGVGAKRDITGVCSDGATRFLQSPASKGCKQECRRVPKTRPGRCRLPVLPVPRTRQHGVVQTERRTPWNSPTGRS